VRRLFKALLKVTAWAVGLIAVVYSIAYLKFNDEVLGGFISDRVNKVERGSFVLGYAHFDYASGLASLLFNTPAHAVGMDYELRDPDGNLVLKVPYAETEVYIQELVGSLLKYAVTRDFTLNLHFRHGHVPKGIAVIAPTRSTWMAAKPEVNLVAAMSPRVPPEKKKPKGGEFRVTVEDAQIDDAHFAIGFPDAEGKVAWYAKFAEASTRASLVYSSREELASSKGPYFFFKIQPLSVEQADLKMGGYQFPLTNVEVSEFGPNGDKREDILFRGTAKTLGAGVSVDGALTDSYGEVPGVTMALQFDHGAALLRQLPQPLDRWLGGDPRGRVRIRGTFKKILVDGDVAGAEADAGGLRISQLATAVAYDPDQAQLKLSPTGKTAGGNVSAQVEVGLERLPWWRAHLSVKHLDPAQIPQLPASLKKELAGRLDATVRLGGSLAKKDVDTIYAQAIDAELERAHPGSLPTRIKLTGALDWAPTRVQLKDVQMGGDGLTVAATGEVDPRSGRLATSLRVDSQRGSTWLRNFGRRDIKIGEAHATGKLSGTLQSPEVDGHIQAKNVSVRDRSIDRVDADVSLHNGDLLLDQVRGEAFDGSFTGDAELGLFVTKGQLALRDRRTLRAHLHGQDMQLQRAIGWDGVEGAAEMTLAVEGQLDDPTGRLEVKLPRLTLKGDKYTDGRLALELGNGGATVRDLKLQRVKGGSLAGSGRVGWDGAMDLQLKPHGFPLEAIPGIRGLPVALSGTVSGDVSLGGDPGRPALGGTIALAAFKVRDTLLGDGKLTMLPGTDAIAIKGSLFGKVSVDGYLTLFPKFTVAGTLKFVDIELERIFPEMRRLAEVRGRTSGEARIAFDGQQGLTYAALTLDPLTLTLSGTEEEGRVRHLVVRNQDPVRMSTDGTVLKIERANLTSSLGAFQVQGQVAAHKNDVHLHGQIGLELLEYFFRGAFEHTHGDAFVDLSIKGDIEKPDLAGVLDLKHAVLVPKGMEHKLTVPVGRVDFTENAVTLRNLTLLMDDARATASGSIDLVKWVPGAIRGEVHGDVSMRLLQWLFKDEVADATGRVAVDVKLGGTFSDPRWAGRADIKSATGKLRRWEHQLAIESGTLTFANADIVLGCAVEVRDANCRTLHGFIDEHPLNLDGTVTVGGPDHWKAMDIHLDGTELRQETPDYVITFSPHVQLRGSPHHLSALGSIDINDGRYIQNFDLVNQFVLKPRTVEREQPFWTTNETLETMALMLEVHSTGPLYIKSNVADLSMQAQLRVTGTLSEPHLDGQLLVEEGGRYTIPGFRVQFDSTPGSVRFEGEKKIPEQTPIMDVGGEGVFTDENDNGHQIKMRIIGTVVAPQLKLEAPSDGWDQTTVLSVLFTGRTPEQWRRLGQNDPTQPARGTNVSASEGVLKTATGWGVGQVIANPIQQVFGFDTTTIEFGTGSFDLRACKRFGRYFKTCSYGEVGFSATSRVQQSLEMRFHDWVGLRGNVEYVNHGIDTSQDSLTRGRLELRLQFPLGF
jgi:hypothetical protein